MSEAAAQAGDDESPLVSRLTGHAKLGRIVERFVGQLPDKLEQMQSAAQRADMVELAALAHWLKGAGGSMGFDDLFEPSKALEMGARAGDAAVVTAVLAELQVLARRIARGRAAPQDKSLETA
jgi:HPt (histidine-containing phosphotransfer) domain-containing protein